MAEPSLYHSLCKPFTYEVNITKNQPSLSQSHFRFIPVDIIKLIFERLAKLNNSTPSRSSLQTCKLFYCIGFIPFHKEMTTEFFLDKIRNSSNAIYFFLLPNQSLSALPRIDVAANSNEAIRLSSENGYLEAVKVLLQDARVDPADDNNYAICRATWCNRVDVVKCLLEDKRINPSINDNFPIRMASALGHLEVVKILLQYRSNDPNKRINPAVNDNEPIKLATANGRIEVVKLLVKDKRLKLYQFKQKRLINQAHKNFHNRNTLGLIKMNT